MDDIMDLVMDKAEKGHHFGLNQDDNALPSSSNPLAENKCPDNCNKILFADLCGIFEKVEAASGKTAKLRIVFDKALRQIVGKQSVFPMIRLLLPLNDPDRPRYNLKQTNVANTYIRALNLNKMSGDAQSLLHWKDPSKVTGAKTSVIISGDFGTILERVLRNRSQSHSSDVTIGEVNLILDDLALAVGQDAKAVVIRDRIRPSFCASEQKWLMRIVFQDLKIGLGYEAVLSALSPDALRRYNECTNLRMVVEEEGGADTETTGLCPFSKFSPMLARGFPSSSHGQVAAVEAAMDGNPFLLDVKLDGERMLVHIEHGEVIMFSRSGTDYTEFYAPLADIIMRNVTVPSCILDGEVMAWDNDAESFVPFGGNKRVGTGEREAREAAGGRAGWDRGLSAWLVFTVFDIVYISGTGSRSIVKAAVETSQVPVQDRAVLLKNMQESVGDICHLPLDVRRRVLKGVVRLVEDRLVIVQCLSVTSLDITARKAQLEAFFNTVTLAGEEGLVVKDLASPYLIGEKSRKSAKWVKMKPEYGDQTTDLDLIVIGANYGQGKGLRGKGLSTFTCGVKDLTSGELKYHTVCRVGGGFTYEELREFRAKLDKVKQPWSAHKTCPSLAPWKISKKDDQPDFFIPPCVSFVLQIKCAELVPSISFSAGVTCRFPRLQRFRYDKGVEDIMTLTELLDYKNQTRNSTHEAFDRLNGLTNKKVGGVKKTEKLGKDTEGRVDDMFSVSRRQVAEEGAFKGEDCYCVVDSDFTVEHPMTKETTRKYSRDEIISMIQEGGGVVVGTPAGSNTLIIVGRKSSIFQIQNYIENGRFDVIHFSYVLDCAAAGKKVEMKNTYFLGYSEGRRGAIGPSLDPFDISLTDDVTPADLARIFATMGDRVALVKKRKKQCDLSVASDKNSRGRDRGEVSVLLHYEKIFQSSWRSIARGLDEDAKRVLHCPQNELWNDTMTVFVDMYADLGPTTHSTSPSTASLVKRDPVDVLLAGVCVRLRLRGADTSTSLHTAVTHVLTDIHDEARMARIKSRMAELSLLPGNIHNKTIMSSDWAALCILCDKSNPT